MFSTKRSQNAKVFYELKEGIKIPLAKKVRGIRKCSLDIKTVDCALCFL
jgi:hypothetical protein